ncbi:beta-propeller fold lactonase family protein [Marinicella litoralis]|uniref:6-phosphogluconolactonase (Cycloisomerase 2 family) n=1 Tax=Marinicella litoralis TaxID=644220 RepID=A0A4R6XGK4_9GAMM|nr:beta-propeller fold lactonase family protein [Marinicella litoralis]TDR18535.1 6-phosphogluconolactonase (cycloisomerase 2 family) [Marinicella litoralis]
MKNYMKVICLSLMLFMVPVDSEAKLSQPDYVLYGTATWFGGPLATESEVSIYLNNQLITVAKYSMGRDTNLNGLYALRVPMDNNDPRTFGKARPGDPASIFIDGNLVADVLIGDYGVAERLDIDPINLANGASVINISPGSVTEVDSGQVDLFMTITLSSVAESDVTVDWQNIDGTAIGGDSCDLDVDYLNSSGTALIPIGQSQTQISIPVCGDTLIELSETFDIVLSNAQNGIIQFDRGEATILDNDGQPELRGYDMVVFEPDSGVLNEAFEFKLSRAYDQEVRVNYQTVGGSAVANVDFVSSSGQIVIPVGETTAMVNIDFLADAIDEGLESMTLQLSNPVNTTLVYSELSAFILDANKEEQTTENGRVTSDDVPDLINPSDVQFSPNGEHVYVSTLSDGGSLLKFGFANGVLTHQETINSSTPGFESGFFGLIRDITLSADGRFMYAAASGDQALMSIQRDTNSGVLSLTQTIENRTPDDIGLDGVYGLTISPDGSHLYAVGSQSDSLLVFEINSTDGSLTHLETELQGVNDPSDQGPPVSFMDRPLDVVVSPDGMQVFVASDFSSSMSVFNRDLATGLLSFQESFKNAVSGISGLGGAKAVTVSNDNRQVYVLGRASDSIVRFDRSVNGVITFTTVFSQENDDFIGLDSPTALLGSHDDSRLYVLGFEDSSLVTFERNKISSDANFGELTFADIEQDDVRDIESMAGPVALDLDSTGRWLLVAAGVDNAIEIFNTHLYNLIFKDGFE